MMPSKDWVLFICILSGLTECDRTKVQGLTPLELKSASSSFVARSPAEAQQRPPPAAPGKTYHRVLPQLRGLGAGGAAGVGAAASPVRTSRSRRMRTRADDREPMSEVVSSRYSVKRISASRETLRGSVAETYCVMEMLLVYSG